MKLVIIEDEHSLLTGIAQAAHFKVSQEAFNRPYKLVAPINAHLKNASVMNTKKKIAVA
jgi:hypothetical protein